MGMGLSRASSVSHSASLARMGPKHVARQARDGLTADGRDETAQVRRGGQDLDAVSLGAIVRERPRRQDDQDRKRECDESEVPRLRAWKGEGPALPSSRQRLPAFATQMLF